MNNLKEANYKLFKNEKFVLSAVEFLVLKDILEKHAKDPKARPDKLKMLRATKRMHKRTIYEALRALLSEEEYGLFEELFPSTIDKTLARFLIKYALIKEYFLGAYELQYNYTVSFIQNTLTQDDVVHYKMAANTLRDIFRVEYKWR